MGNASMQGFTLPFRDFWQHFSNKNQLTQRQMAVVCYEK
jgi:hypothetical protein